MLSCFASTPMHALLLSPQSDAGVQAADFEAQAAGTQQRLRQLQQDKAAVLRTLVATEIELQRLASRCQVRMLERPASVWTLIQRCC